MADYSDPLGLLFGGVDYFGSAQPQQGRGLLQLTPQEIERMAAAQSPAFGVFPQMQPYRSQQDITASANVPVDVARGRVAGTLGLFGDVFNQPIPMVRPLQLLSQAMTGQQKYPDTEYFLENLPLKSDTPVGDVAGRIGSFAPINPMPVVKGVQKLGGLLGEEMATRLSTGRPILPSLLAEPQTAMFAVNPAEQAATSGLLQAEVSPLGFYSAVEQQALKIPRKQGTGESFLNDLLKGQDVKKYEIEAMGLDTYLKGKPNVTRQEVQDFIQNNKINVEERQLGGTITEDPIGIAKRKEVFDKYEPEIQQLYSELDNVTAKKRNALKLATAKYDDMLLQLNKDGYMPTAQDYEAFNLAEKELTQANRMQNDDIDIRNRLGKIQSIRDAEADAAYLIPEKIPTRYEKYQLAGGENYRELLLTLPSSKSSMDEFLQMAGKKYGGDTPRNQWSPEDNAMYEKLLQEERTPTNTEYRSSHFPDPNILAHMRVNDRIDAEGKKMLLIEEVQSDWHQAGREQGYKKKTRPVSEIQKDLDSVIAELRSKPNVNYSPTEDDWARYPEITNKYDALQAEWDVARKNKEGVPDAPFKDTWYQLALKRAIKEAVDKGYDRIGLTTGAQQASRYNLSNEVDEINVIGRTDARTGEKSRQVALDLKSGGSYKLGVNNEGIIDNVNMLEIQNLQGKNLADVVGKEVAKKIMESNSQTIKGEGLNIGGEGMKKYYDEIYPNFLNKYGKKYGAQVGETKVNTIKERAENSMIPASKQETVRYLDITPEMRKAVQKGQPLAAVEGMTGLLA